MKPYANGYMLLALVMLTTFTSGCATTSGLRPSSTETAYSCVTFGEHVNDPCPDPDATLSASPTPLLDHVVTYRVTDGQLRSVSLSYYAPVGNGEAALVQKDGLRLPFSKTYVVGTDLGNTEGLSLAAASTSVLRGDMLVCQILVDGVVVDHQEATGQGSFVICRTPDGDD